MFLLQKECYKFCRSLHHRVESILDLHLPRSIYPCLFLVEVLWQLFFNFFPYLFERNPGTVLLFTRKILIYSFILGKWQKKISLFISSCISNSSQCRQIRLSTPAPRRRLDLLSIINISRIATKRRGMAKNFKPTLVTSRPSGNKRRNGVKD